MDARTTLCWRKSQVIGGNANPQQNWMTRHASGVMDVNMSMRHHRLQGDVAKWDLSATNITQHSAQNGMEWTNSERGDGLLTDCQWMPARE